jgi:hypothetical protein
MTKEMLTKETVTGDLLSIRKSRFAVIRTVFLLTFVPLHLIALFIIWVFESIVGRILFYVALGISLWYFFEMLRYAVYKKSVRDGKYIIETDNLTAVEDIVVVESRSRHSVVKRSVPHLCFGERKWRADPVGGADREAVCRAAEIGDTYFVVSKAVGSPILCAYNGKQYAWEENL